MKVSVIVAIYKDTEALDAILDSLYKQSYTGEYEVIVAEDGQDEDVQNYIQSLTYPNLVHTTQIDEGWRKNKSLNNAIRASSGDLLIFLDGDCIPYSNLIENYVKLKENKTVLCGRRVELGAKISTKLRKKELHINELENSYLRRIISMYKDNTNHYEEGIKFNNFLYNLKYKNKSSHIIGCNFALNREDIYEINGFNEEYHSAAVGEDTDIEYRLAKIGCLMKPARNLCNIVHLYHKVSYSADAHQASTKIFNHIKEKNEIFCKNGLKTI
ncbi:MAG: glycosyltransferase [Thiovulaceae bacterium]|nr:glycosyltransferase [Sulfurimonadaceae bacterium]MCW9025967.1 glycosyltransferase [Sulfurimonadaceae bacterium]